MAENCAKSKSKAVIFKPVPHVFKLNACDNVLLRDSRWSIKTPSCFLRVN